MSKLIKLLAAATGLTESDVRSIIVRAPVSYKHYTIAKRTGGRRPISQPAREVKALQRVLAHRLRHLPVHDAATAYRAGQSIRSNAERHAKNGPIMKFDFSNFFPSIKARDWQNYCEQNSIFSSTDDILLSALLFFHQPRSSSNLRLAIGAPSSPWLSNVLMYEFDERISAMSAIDKVTYTRYADDITFSAKRTGYLNSIPKNLRDIVKDNKNPALLLNEEKTVVATTKYRRVVTGLILADDGRVTLGRDRKRLIRSMVHHAVSGRNTSEQNGRLAGLLAFAADIEPDFVAAINARYGSNLPARLAAPDFQSMPTISDIFDFDSN